MEEHDGREQVASIHQVPAFETIHDAGDHNGTLGENNRVELRGQSIRGYLHVAEFEPTPVIGNHALNTLSLALKRIRSQ